MDLELPSSGRIMDLWTIKLRHIVDAGFNNTEAVAFLLGFRSHRYTRDILNLWNKTQTDNLNCCSNVVNLILLV